MRLLNKEEIKHSKYVLRITKSRFYMRVRKHFPSPVAYYLDDREALEDGEVIRIDWPEKVAKPYVGVIQDEGNNPRWTKYRRFLENNHFPFDLYNLESHDWLAKARPFDMIVGMKSCNLYDLQEMRKKFHILETYLGKACYPAFRFAMMYEDKSIESYISQSFGLPFAKSYVSYDKDDALRLAETLTYPVVSKIDASSASVGVEIVRDARQARRIVEDAFSRYGRETHRTYERQKNYIYFQEFIPNDGYDIRVMVIGKQAFGYYRKALQGDFRASGMNQVEWGELPEEAMRTAWRTNQCIQSPMLVVDMVHGLDGKYSIVEFSPFCLTESPRQLRVNEVPGVFVQKEDGTVEFKPGKYWVDELAFREFLLTCYLPNKV